MRTEALLKLLRLGQMQAWEVFDAMGGTWESVTEALNEAIAKDLVTWTNGAGGRFYRVKE
jgi:hypothetical protein